MNNYTIAEFYIRNEYRNATEKYPKMVSAHEGYAILKEELDELWDEIKKKNADHNLDLMRKEAIQVAAMAIRFIIDVCDKEVI